MPDLKVSGSNHDLMPVKNISFLMVRLIQGRIIRVFFRRQTNLGVNSTTYLLGVSCQKGESKIIFK